MNIYIAYQIVKYSILTNVIVGDNSSSKFCLTYAFVATHKIEPKFVMCSGVKQNIVLENEKILRCLFEGKT